MKSFFSSDKTETVERSLEMRSILLQESIFVEQRFENAMAWEDCKVQLTVPRGTLQWRQKSLR